MRDIEYHNDGIDIVATPHSTQSSDELQKEVDRSVVYLNNMIKEGTQLWKGQMRTFGPFAVYAAKEVGPPPWWFPHIKIRPGWRTWIFGIGYRSTAYWLYVNISLRRLIKRLGGTNG